MFSLSREHEGELDEDYQKVLTSRGSRTGRRQYGETRDEIDRVFVDEFRCQPFDILDGTTVETLTARISVTRTLNLDCSTLDDGFDTCSRAVGFNEYF